MTVTERLERTEPDERRIQNHVARYAWAAEAVWPGDVVLDAACGTGYGRDVLPSDATWVGVDRYQDHGGIVADLMDWEPDFDFDVFVGLETLEHLPRYDHYVNVAKRARRSIVISVPIIPSTHINPYHLHDFTAYDVPRLFSDWKLVRKWYQFGAVGLYHFNRTGE
jgi:hypothetical protein